MIGKSDNINIWEAETHKFLSLLLDLNLINNQK